MKAPLTASTSPGSSSPRRGRPVLAEGAAGALAAADAGEVGEGRERGGEGALAGVVELARLGHQLHPDHPDPGVGVEPRQRRVERAGVDLGVGVEQQDRVGLPLSRSARLLAAEKPMLAARSSRTSGNSRATMSGSPVGAAAVDHRHPHLRLRGGCSRSERRQRRSSASAPWLTITTSRSGGPRAWSRDRRGR